MNILHLAIGIGPTSFGVSRVVLNLARRQIEAGHRVHIWSSGFRNSIDWASKISGIDHNCFQTFDRVGPRSLIYSPDMERAIVSGMGNTFDVMHQHAIWGLFGRVTYLWHHVTNKPFVISPHGALEPYYFRQGRIKKWIAGVVYANYLFRHASCIHACSDKESKSIRAVGLVNPVAIIPNGIDITSYNPRPIEMGSKHHNKRRLLFLSRIIPEKGLEMLLEAVAQVPYFRNGWMLDIAGSGDEQFLQLLRSKVVKLGLVDCVHFVGFVDGDEKDKLIKSSDLFILPSYSENFGVVVAEALNAGVPAIATFGTPWSDLLDFKCGWWVSTDVSGITTAIDEATRMPAHVLHRMGENGRQLVKNRYSLDSCGDMSIEMYKWMLHDIGKPSFINCVSDPYQCGLV